MLLFYGIRISKVTGRRITKVLTGWKLPFAIEGEKSIFDGLEISKDTKLCEAYMGKYPVISISLKRNQCSLLNEDAFDFAVSDYAKNSGRIPVSIR